jgi:hypothetical protein
MNARIKTPTSGAKAEKVKPLRELARALTGDDPAGRDVWRRMLLGRLAGLLLDDSAKLTGAELRAMLETFKSEPETATTGAAGARLPAEFESIVQEIYGVNLQRDVKGAEDPPSNRGGMAEGGEAARQKK